MNRIKSLRIEEGLTQTEVAEKLGISRQVFANYENEINQPTPEMLIKIADCFGVSVDYLIGRSDEFGMSALSVAVCDDDAEEIKTLFGKLNEKQQKFVIKFIKFLQENESFY